MPNTSGKKPRPRVSANTVASVSPGKPFIRGSSAPEQAKTVNRIAASNNAEMKKARGSAEHGKRLKKADGIQKAFIETMQDRKRKIATTPKKKQ